MRRVAVLSVLALPLLSSAVAETPLSLAAADRVVDAITGRLASVEPHASEYRKARFTTLADLDGDSQPEAVSMFTIEGVGGGNNYTFYISVLKADPKLSQFIELGTLRVGGKGVRSLTFDKLTIHNGQIAVPTLSYAPQDAMCCPSVPGVARFELKGGKVHEVSSAP